MNVLIDTLNTVKVLIEGLNENKEFELNTKAKDYVDNIIYVLNQKIKDAPNVIITDHV